MKSKFLIVVSILLVVIIILTLQSSYNDSVIKNIPNETNLTETVYFIYDNSLPIDDYKNYTLYEPGKKYYFNNSMSALSDAAVYIEIENTGKNLNYLKVMPIYWAAYQENGTTKVELISNPLWTGLSFTKIPTYDNVILNKKYRFVLDYFHNGEKVGLFLLFNFGAFKEIDKYQKFGPMFELRGMLEFYDENYMIVKKVPFKSYYLVP